MSWPGQYEAFWEEMPDEDGTVSRYKGPSISASVRSFAPFLGLTVHVIVRGTSNEAVWKEGLGVIESITRDNAEPNGGVPDMFIHFVGGASVYIPVTHTTIELNIISTLRDRLDPTSP